MEQFSIGDISAMAKTHPTHSTRKKMEHGFKSSDTRKVINKKNTRKKKLVERRIFRHMNSRIQEKIKYEIQLWLLKHGFNKLTNALLYKEARSRFAFIVKKKTEGLNLDPVGVMKCIDERIERFHELLSKYKWVKDDD